MTGSPGWEFVLNRRSAAAALQHHLGALFDSGKLRLFAGELNRGVKATFGFLLVAEFAVAFGSLHGGAWIVDIQDACDSISVDSALEILQRLAAGTKPQPVFVLEVVEEAKELKHLLGVLMFAVLGLSCTPRCKRLPFGRPTTRGRS